jgi:hypothetical protein
MLRYFLHIKQPEDLSDEEWSMRLAELEYIRKLEAGKR